MAKRPEPRHRRKPEGSREIRERLLILCEGSQTEYLYFNAFPKANVVVDVVHVDGGGNAPTFIQRADLKRNVLADKGEQFDRVFCVFDYDYNSPQDFNQAIATARRLNLQPVFSNVCFELWYLLHFGKTFTGSPKQHESELSKAIRKACNKPKFTYSKNDPGMFRLLEPFQKESLVLAARLASACSRLSPSSQCPCTKVHELVELLNSFHG